MTKNVHPVLEFLGPTFETGVAGPVPENGFKAHILPGTGRRARARSWFRGTGLEILVPGTGAHFARWVDHLRVVSEFGHPQVLKF